MEQSNENSSQGKINFEQDSEQELTEKLTKNKVTPDMCRLAFYTLLGAAMAYREMYFRDDIERFKNSPPPQVEQVRTKGTSKLTAKGVRKIHNENNAAFERNIIKFNQAAYREIDATSGPMTRAAKSDLEEVTGFLTSCTEELLHAHDKHEIHSLLKMYNAGALDFMFEEIRKQKQTKDLLAHETTPTSPQ